LLTVYIELKDKEYETSFIVTFLSVIKLIFKLLYVGIILLALELSIIFMIILFFFRIR
jgi:hypothetical protein